MRGGDAGGLGAGGGKECGLSLRRTPGMRQKVSATTPISSMQGGGTRVKGVFIVPRHAGHDQRALRPQGAGRGDQPGRAACSHRVTFERSGPAARRPAAPRAWSWAIKLGDRLGGHEGIISAPTRVGIAVGRKTQGFQSQSPVAQSGRVIPAPFQRENRAPEGGVFFLWGFTAALPL